MKSLISYSYRQGESIEELSKDPDSRLVPSVVEKVVLPWIGREYNGWLGVNVHDIKVHN